MNEELRRVVSEADVIMADTTDDEDQQQQQSIIPSTSRGMVRQHANVHDLSKPPKAPFAVIENHHTDDIQYDSSSTLSNDVGDDPEDDTPLVQFTTNRLHRTNSRSSSSSSQMAPSSQTSSRDWGWFEDVHVSDRRLNKGSNHNKDESGSNAKRKAKNPNTMDENGKQSLVIKFIL